MREFRNKKLTGVNQIWKMWILLRQIIY
jgi:hypothetical protein